MVDDHFIAINSLNFVVREVNSVIGILSIERFIRRGTGYFPAIIIAFTLSGIRGWRQIGPAQSNAIKIHCCCFPNGCIQKVQANSHNSALPVVITRHVHPVFVKLVIIEDIKFHRFIL